MKKHSMSHSSTHSPVVAGRQLAVVIVNYRTASLTIDSIRSLSRETDSYSLNCRVIVVDNASGDGSVEQITAAIEDQGWGEWVSVLAMDRNGGFSAGNNAGIHEILSADPEVGYILLLNPDTIVQPGGLRELVEFLDRHPRAGIAGSRLENADFTVQCSAHRRPSPLGELEDTAKLGVISKLLSRARISPPPRQEAHPCDWVSGASLIIRREVFDQIGFFDEGYFLYFEEVDLCLRAQRAGWEVWYVPASRVVHLEGASTGIANGRKRRGRYWYDSRRRFYVKHYGLCGLLATDMLWVLGRLVFLARHLGGLDGSTAGDPKRFAADLLWGDMKALVTGKWRVRCSEATG